MSCPQQLRKYFQLNWHNIREDWSLYSLKKNNLGNTTNNRLESINGKLKLVLIKNSPLVITIKDFFEWYDSRNTESQFRTAKQFLRVPNLPFDIDSPEQKYVKSKRKIVQTKTSKLVNIVSLSCGLEFDRKCKVLDNVIDDFSSNKKFRIVYDEEELESSFKNLSIDNTLDEDRGMDLSSIKTPAKINVIGRPSEF
ncbi:hypothetical protein KQX54_009657 [Cotesia glomerata]|uniref:Uncharacterized protein n=1 Tax=Cotesia glomerata TaxID=32391 RepID=A0AAV7IYH1_COTGL|nr:hypothetical protein KQX54_009657 [Cotesia glomerata]